LKQSDEEELLEEDALEDEPMEDDNNNEGTAGLGDDEQGAHSSEVVSELFKEKKKKKDGKEKREKKDKRKKDKDDKKQKKHAKRRKFHEGSSDDDGDKEHVQAPARTEQDMAMEEELFGPDD